MHIHCDTVKTSYQNYTTIITNINKLLFFLVFSIMDFSSIVFYRHFHHDGRSDRRSSEPGQGVLIPCFWVRLELAAMWAYCRLPIVPLARQRDYMGQS